MLITIQKWCYILQLQEFLNLLIWYYVQLIKAQIAPHIAEMGQRIKGGNMQGPTQPAQLSQASSRPELHHTTMKKFRLISWLKDPVWNGNFRYLNLGSLTRIFSLLTRLSLKLQYTFPMLPPIPKQDFHSVSHRIFHSLLMF